MPPLARACVAIARDFNAQDAANSLWACAKLGLTDSSIVAPLARACVAVARDFNAQEASNSHWACATLGLMDTSIVTPLARACVALARDFNAQDAANSLWACATLGLTDSSVVGPISLQVSRCAAALSLEEAHQVLQSHFCGLAVEDATLSACWALHQAHPERPTISEGQRAVAASLKRLGFSTELEAKVLRSLLSIDIVATEPPAGAGAPEAGRRCRSIAVEFDGPQHFSRVFAAPNAGGEAAFARGPPTAATALRDRLIRRHGGFAGLVVVPFFEWDACANKPEREDAYLARLLGCVA